jgi:phosphatidylserine/phosphatidylglycerophosphate/cardiolipin synthase-like enzyme
MNTGLALGFALICLAIGGGIGFVLAPHQPRVGTVAFTVTSTVSATVSTTVAGQSLVQHCFSPEGNCAKVLASWFDRANVSIHALIYSFTLNNVRDALIRAKDRGVDVKLVMEKENVNASGSEYQSLKSAGIDIRFDNYASLLHDKFAVIDGHIIITGSMNWTVAATVSNFENIVVIDSAQWAEAFEQQFQHVYAASSR